MSRDQIRIDGIEVFGFHGVHDDEQERGQRFLVDLVLEAGLAVAGRSDHLSDTVDYSEVVRRVHDVVTLERWNLLERIATRVAETVLEFSPVESVRVTVHKPEAPIEVPTAGASVRITRSR